MLTMGINQVSELRPWGKFTVLMEDNNYKVKKLEISPGHRLSMQFHQHRNEHWIVVEGMALVTVNSTTSLLKADESVFITANSIHRMENIGQDILVVIEVQYGTYLDETDTIRLVDDYDR